MGLGADPGLTPARNQRRRQRVLCQTKVKRSLFQQMFCCFFFLFNSVTLTECCRVLSWGLHYLSSWLGTKSKSISPLSHRWHDYLLWCSYNWRGFPTASFWLHAVTAGSAQRDFKCRKKLRSRWSQTGRGCRQHFLLFLLKLWPHPDIQVLWLMVNFPLSHTVTEVGLLFLKSIVFVFEVNPGCN